MGFRKEQVTANLLNGKGEIRDVELNCDFLNETASKLSPFVAFESVRVSKVSFYVSSWTNIRKAPIFIDIEHVTAKLVEPLQFLNETEGRKALRQITRQQLANLLQQGILKSRGAYNLFDRILDNLTVEVSSVQVSFQPWGKFKTRRPGPWTPPALELSLANLRFVSVDELGHEGPPEEVWRHNNHHHRQHAGSLLIYKKCELQYKAAITPVNGIPIPLVTGKDNKMEIHVAIERRIRDGEVLAVQIDTTIPNVEVDLKQEAIPHVAHALAGVTYLLSKDREFQDPLVPEQSQMTESNRRIHVPIVTTLDSMGEEVGDKTTESAAPAAVQDATDVQLNIEDESSDEDDEVGEVEGKVSGGGDEPKQDQQQQASFTRTDSTASAAAGRTALPDHVKNEPVIVLPNGIVIHQKICMSVSIYDAVIRGLYGPDCDDKNNNADESTTAHPTGSSSGSPTNNNNITHCFELVSKGCVVEVIWPKVTKEKGGYVQASVSYFALEEKYQQQIKTLMCGGVKFHADKNPVESPSRPLPEVGRDETFPLFEDRVVRPDPLGLRFTFPAQACGLKTTVDFIEQSSFKGASNISNNAVKEKIQVLHEIGVDRVDFAVEAPSWCRILSFVVNEQGGGFDARWHSGDWSNDLSPRMLVSPSAPLDLDDCLQKTKQLFLDENDFISSDLLNLTARLTQVETRIPACIHQDIKSCDIVMKLDEVMLLVSSALPRTMLSGRIGNSVNGDDLQTKGIIEFPNDRTDVAYELEKAEDPSKRQRGLDTSRAISTFRAQLTLRGFSVELKPAIDFYTGHREPLLAPSELTMIFCFEGEPPETPEDNLTKTVVFLSMLIHRYDVNLDLDLLASALSTLMYHGTTLYRRLMELAEVVQRSMVEDNSESPLTDDATPSDEDKPRIPRSLRGRRVLVHKQLVDSRESGGISVALGIQIAELRTRLWRQHVLVSQEEESSAGSHDKNDSSSDRSKQHILPAVNLMDCSMKNLELGFEAALKKDSRRLVLKGCLSTVEAKVCDFNKLRAHVRIESDRTNSKADGKGQEEATEKMSPADYLVEVLSLKDQVEGGERMVDYAVGFRLEEMLEGHRRWSFSTDLANGGILHVRPEAIEALAVNIFEALLMPYDDNLAEYMQSDAKVFPNGTVGSILFLVVPTPEAAGIDTTLLLKPSTLFSGKRTPVEKVEALLQMVIERFVPQNVDVVLFRSRIENMIVAISSRKMSGFYSFNSHFADFVVTYFLEGKPSDERILHTTARKEESWFSLIDNYETGLHHRLKARQSLSRQDSDSASPADLRYFVPPHNLSYSYTQSKARIEMNEGVEIGGMDLLDDFLSCLQDFRIRFRQMSQNMNRIVASMQSRTSTVDEEATSEPADRNPAVVATEKTIGSIRNAKQSMNEVHSHLQSYCSSVGSLFSKMQNCLDMLRFEAFQKEKDRLAALAVASNQATGWLRLGTPGRTGQRGTITATLWPYWAVLRKGLILVHSSPNKTQVIDIIPLQGATLYINSQLGTKRGI